MSEFVITVIIIISSSSSSGSNSDSSKHLHQIFMVKIVWLTFK